MCVSPNSIKVVNKYTGLARIVGAKCGHCYECVRKRKLDWEMRLTIESSTFEHTFFGMLTYNDECYHPDVQHKEISYFIKRLRYNLNKYYPGAKLKYFLVSEYGELRDRLHYHVLYFVSKEFTDTFREFQELVGLSWVKKVPLDDHQIAFRKSVLKRYSKTHKDKTSSEYLDILRWSRRKYDDISIGFATAQMLRGGTAVGSIHYACKYIQKQYNKMYFSRCGFVAWRDYMVKKGYLEFNIKEGFSKSNLFIPNFPNNAYPTFPVRGFCYPVPSSWLRSTIGKNATSYYSQKLAERLSQQPKFIDENRLQSFWHREPERSAFVDDKRVKMYERFHQSYLERTQFYEVFSDVLDKWQISMIRKLMPSSQEGQNLICPSEIPLPLNLPS